MKTIIAVLLGLLAGIMIYMMSAMLFVDLGSGDGPSGRFVAITLLGGWASSAVLLRRGATSVSRIFSRGFLMGAAMWMAMIVVGVIYAGRAVALTEASSDAEAAGAAIGGGLFAVVSSGVSIFMVVFCLVGFMISYLIGRQMRPEEQAVDRTVSCPSCAEPISPMAKKCKHCGDLIEPSV